MKKNAIALAVAAAMTAPAAALADVTVYGKAHLAVNNASGDDSSEAVSVESRASRVGVKGSEDLGNGLTAVYKMEWDVNMEDHTADGGADNLKSRNQYAGLAGGFGTVLLGRHDTPLKMAQGKFDQFNDTTSDIKHTIPGEDRVGNVVAYVSPSFGPAKVVAAAWQGENQYDGGDGFADIYSVALMAGDKKFKKSPYYVGVGYNGGDTDTVALKGGTYDSLVRIVGGFGMGNFGVNGLYTTASDVGGGDEDFDGFGLSGYFKMGANKLKAQYMDTEMGEMEESQVSVGVDHTFTKRTSAYAMFDTFDEADVSNISVGLVHKF